MNVMFSISAHGYGHGALSVPVVEALWQQSRDLQVTLHTRLPREWLAGRLSGPFNWTGRGHDFGMHMHSPVDIDVPGSALAYDGINDNWEALVEAEQAVLHEYKPDIVVSNISFLILEAARREGVPAVTLCPFNWLDIHRVYCNDFPGAGEVQEKMRIAYASAVLHIKPEPSVPGSDGWPERAVGPIRASGTNRHAQLQEALGTRGKKLILVSFGGIEGWADWDFMAPVDGWQWIVAGACPVQRPDVTPAGDIPMSFTDLLASVDLVVTKPGYATFTEAVAAGVPVASLERPDWPEWPYLVDFVSRHVAFGVVKREMLFDGGVISLLEGLLARGVSAGYLVSGEADAADVIDGVTAPVVTE